MKIRIGEGIHDGIGFQIQAAYQTLQIRRLFAWALVLILVILVFNHVLPRLGRLASRIARPAGRRGDAACGIEDIRELRSIFVAKKAGHRIALEGVAFAYGRDEPVIAEHSVEPETEEPILAPDATVIVAPAWLGLLLLLMAAYYLTYLGKYRLRAGKGAALPFALSALLFLCVAAIQVAVHLLSVQPGRWEGVLAQPWTLLADRAFVPRFLHFVLAGVTLAGILLAWIAVRRPPAEEERANASARAMFGVKIALLATVLQLVVGLWLTISVPREVLLGLMRGGGATMAPFTIGIFAGFGLLVFLAMTSLLALAQHLGLLWVAMEATTLATAPLLYFNRTARSLEATWKYLMIGSVGIAIALLGSLFLAYSAHVGGAEPSLLFDDLLAGAGTFSRPWLRASFVLLLVGYGTKMGLAPLHTWKPDAYGEASGIVGALLAGGMTNCAFLALLRVYRVVNAAGEGDFARELLVFMGLLSIALAAVFVVRQRDIKRMLAYSSVEHVGILVLGIGLGGIGVFGALLHAINNGLTKGILFLSAGNIHRAYGSKNIDEVYNKYHVEPDVKVLLTTDHPKNDSTVCWVRPSGGNRVVFLQLGHDGKAYVNPSFRRLVARSIRWSVGRL